MVWCVVHFTLDDTVEVVPAQWYRKEGNCAWPKTSNIKDIKMAVINKTRPNKHDFSFYEARCLASNIDKISKAQKKCNIAKCKSDLSSMEDDKLNKKRKIKNNLLSESDSEQSDTPMLSKNAIPCYDSDSKPRFKKIHQNKSLSQTTVGGIQCRSNGWSPLKTSIIGSPETKSIIMCDARTIISPSISPLKLSDKRSSLFSEKMSPNNQNVNLLGSSPSAISIKRCLFSDIKSTTEATSVIKKLDKRSTNNSNSKMSKKDDQFKDTVLHSLIILKHCIRNLDEKMDLLIEKSSRSTENSNTNTNDDDIIDYTNLNCLFPIQDLSTLNDIEEQLVSNKEYYKLLTKKLIGLGGKTVQIYIRRVMQLLFSDELLKLYSFNGRGNKKKCFSNLMISKLIFGSVKMLNKFNYDNATDDAEKYIKNALIQAPFNIKKKLSKCPTTKDD